MNIKNFINKISYIFHLLILSKIFKKPYHVHFQLTRRCNFRCLSCCVWKNEADLTSELKLEEIKILAENLRKIGVKSVALTGGEPLLRKDLFEIINIFKKNNFIVRLQTNGCLINEDFIEKIFSIGLDDIYVSLDSLKPDIFTKINGLENENIFYKVVENIKKTSVIAKKYGVGVFLTTVLQPINIEEVENLNKFAQENNCLIGFYGLEMGDETDKNNIRSCDSQLLPDEKQKKSLKETFVKIKQLKKEKKSPIFNSNKLLDDFINYYSSSNLNMRWNCNAGDYYLEVFANGLLGVCNATPEISGFDYKNIKDLYKNKEKEKIFKKYRKKCNGCICTRQLEYLVNDFSDIINKSLQYINKFIISI